MQRRSHHRALRGRSSLFAAVASLVCAACGGSTSEPTPSPTPTPSVPVRVVVVTAPPATGSASTTSGDFVVRVEDEAGRGVRGVRVQFRAEQNSPYFNFAPADTTTDSTGVARTLLQFGSKVGAGRVSATAEGVVTPALVDITITPGPRTNVILSPMSIRLYGAGDEAEFRAFITDPYLNVLPDVDFGLVTSDPTLLSITPPTTPNGIGRIRALKAGGVATVRSSWSMNVFAIGVTVNTMPRTVCTDSSAPQDIVFGTLAVVSDSTFCLAASARPAEYALIVYNESTDGTASLGTSVTAYNVDSDVSFARVPSGTGPMLSRSPSLRRRVSMPTLDHRFHERLRTRSRSLRALFSRARAARRPAPGAIGGLRPSYSIAGGSSSVPAVDDLLSLNVAGEACTNADMRTFRVEAVSARAIVLADTANPANGFSRADYERFAARFDNLVYPLDAEAFGAPSDIDGNSRVAILFTRAVNELTPPDAGSFVGGFFHPRDLFPRTQTPTIDVCPTSNEGEMFYMLVPDPTGVVNGNEFPRGFVDTLTTGVLAHEFQHLINAGRRMYVNTAATEFEEVWLDEGLSHIAEELLYFRESGFTPRSRLTSQAILDSQAHWDVWVADESSNFIRFYLYLLEAAKHSPIDQSDDLETRGATWAFLRYAVDQRFSTDNGVWQRFGNSTTTGIGTLGFALQSDPRPLLRDFAVTNFAGPLSDPRYLHPSWNFPDVYAQVFVSSAYPRPIGQLVEATAVPVAARGGSASYYRFAVLPDVQALLKFGSAQAPASPDLKFMLVRTR